jgi:hypothetical protein
VAKETRTSEERKMNATVVISVTDVNDNAPIFSQTIYEANVAESPTFPVLVGTVSLSLLTVTPRAPKSPSIPT